MAVPLTLLSLLTFLFLAVVPSHATEYIGHVVAVSNGDTIEVLRNRTAERIRLTGIHCPEKKQAFGQRAKQAISTFRTDRYRSNQCKDRYGRTFDTVVLSDSRNFYQALAEIEGLYKVDII